jgi:hypothetical protein
MSLIPPQYQPLAQSILAILGALYILINLVDKFLQILKSLFPANAKIAWFEAKVSWLATRWPKSIQPPAAAVGLKDTLRKGFTLNRLLPVMVGLAIVAIIACAHLTPLEQTLVNCGDAALLAEANSAAPTVFSILSTGGADWPVALVGLITNVGQGVVCAVEALVSAEAKKGPALSPADMQIIYRGQAFLAAYRYQVTQ